ncbi:MAG: helix-turn-helix transcriptional regulator [Lachnospiraceae bacterium]|nr:helix-turn-helix transcriptional regulator [Lachnospiraceae bacterium]
MVYGKIKINLNEQLAKTGLSKNKFCQRAEMQRTQLNKYLNNEVALLDKDVLGRICTVLDCSINDILEFVPPDAKKRHE